MNIIEKSAAIIAKTENATISLIDEDGFPTGSTISSVRTDGVYTVWFATGMDTPKVKRIKLNNKASVCYTDEKNNVTLVGTIEIITSPEIKSELWVDWFINHFPEGCADPNYCVLKFTTKRMSLWVDNEQIQIDVKDLQKPQSRCGLLCDFCDFKESTGCQGCINIANPFWGECPVKTCCKEKGFIHCGDCPDIPCRTLHEFSCGSGEHCDNPPGLRIMQCKAWAAQGDLQHE